jgi:hypothetical protein
MNAIAHGSRNVATGVTVKAFCALTSLAPSHPTSAKERAATFQYLRIGKPL